MMTAFTPELADKLGGFLSLATLVLTVYVFYVLIKQASKAVKYIYELAVKKLKQSEKIPVEKV